MSEVVQELRKILAEHSPEMLTVIQASPDACWIDGQKCPYGQPRGQFQHRPKIFCVIPIGPGSGCTKLLDNTGEFDQMGRSFIEGEVERRIDSRVDEKEVTLDSELRAVADEVENVEKATLLLAAELVEKIRPHFKIVRTEDL